MSLHRNALEPNVSAGVHRAGFAAAGALLLSGMMGCFTGSGADGLPCENDDDCGPSLSCDSQTQCCGGACLVQTTSSTTTTTSTTTTDPATSDPTLDPTTSSSTTDSSGSTGPAAECGNAAVEGDEQCDLGVELNADPFTACTAECRPPLFLYAPRVPDAEPIPPEPWAAPTVDPNLGATVGWQLNGDSTWGSGPHPEAGMNLRGFKRLPSSPLRFDVADDEEAVLYIGHELDFATCATPVQFDGARVVFQPQGMMVMPVFVAPEPDVGQVMMNIDPLEAEPTCDMLPWAMDPFNAFVLSGQGPRGPFPLPAGALNRMGSLNLEVQYTCGDCGGEDGDEWVVNAISVIVRKRTGG